MPRSRRAVVVALATAAVLAVAGLVTRRSSSARSTGPDVPRHDDEVLERLARPSSDPRAQELRALRRRLAAAPRDLDAATRLARLDIEESRTLADPRLLGQAQAALAPWWAARDAPPVVLVLRATIEQSRHEFDAALVDLDAAVAAEPRDAQAWLTRAVVLSVRARYDEAARSCDRLAPLASRVAVAVCRAGVEGLTGHARAAHDRLRTEVDGRGVDAGERQWALSTLADLAVWSGQTAPAEAYLQEALALDPTDDYARAAYADLLLDDGRAGEVAPLVADRAQNDTLLLRLALAEHATGRSGGAVAAMRQRFMDSRARGDVVHRREESRFALQVERDPARALELAQANFDVQREPWDARVLLEAALAARRPAAARSALDWLHSTGFAEPHLRRLATALGEIP